MKLLILDFDGTLADSKKAWYESIVKILKKEKIYCPECEAKLIIHFGLKIPSILEKLEIDKKKAKKIAKEIYAEFLKKKLKFCPGFSSLKEIKARKIVLSNSMTFVLKKVLGNNQKMFEGIYGGDKFREKSEFIKKLKKNYNVTYVGDRAGDIRTARKAGVRSIIISNRYSWNTRQEILSGKPDFVVGNLKELRKLF